jgi:signal transduction histidine kinase/CheY-like chemotaxis protein
MSNTPTPVVKKISFKIFLAVLMGTLLSISAIGATTFLFTKSLLQNSIMNEQMELAQQTLNKIDRLLYERLSDIQQISGEADLETFLSEHKQGAISANFEESEDLTRRMNELTVVTGPWDVLFVVDTNGKIILSAGKPILGDLIESYPSKLIAYEASMKGDVYYSDLVKSKDTELPTIVFSAPIRNDTNHNKPIVGVVVGNFSWPAALEILSEVPDNAVLLNREGKIIGSAQAMSQPEIIVESLESKVTFPKLNVHRSKSIIIPKGQGILPGETLASIALQTGYLSYKGNDWKLLLQLPVVEAFAPATQTALKLVFLLLPAILIAPLIILLIIVKSVVRPIRILNNAIRLAAEGNLTQQILIKSGDEIGALATSFNIMARKLQNVYDSLEIKVAERTMELKKEIAERQQTMRRVLSQHSVTDILSHSGNLDEAAPHILESICKSLDWECGAIWDVDVNNNVIRCSHLWRLDFAGAQEFENASLQSAFISGIGLPGRVWAQGRPVWISNVTEDANFPRAKIALKAGLHGAIGFPILLDGKVAGVFEFFSFESRKPDVELLQMLETIGVQTGQFIQQKKTEFQLLQSQKMETVGSLAGGIAHDLNNQLTPIRGYLDLLLNQIPAADPTHIMLQEANQAAVRCTEVVERLVNFSKRSTQKKTVLDLGKVLKEFKKLLTNFLPSTIHTTMQCADDLWYVEGNQTELHTVLMNLAANARDAMPDGGTLNLEANNIELHGQASGQEIHSGLYVVISVRDTGAGMFPETVKRIFEPFFSTKAKDKGTGLGLAMVFNIIKDHDGWIDVSSDVGVGTVFQVYLPAKAADSSSPSVVFTKEALPHGKETVLFADDDEKMRTMGRIFLERLGYQVILASDGKEAVEIYRTRKNEIDALILDMTMPHLTGRQVLQKILSINPIAKVILSSGYTNEGSAEEFIHEGAKDFLRKPFTIAPLAQILRNVLDH